MGSSFRPLIWVRTYILAEKTDHPITGIQLLRRVGFYLYRSLFSTHPIHAWLNLEGQNKYKALNHNGPIQGHVTTFLSRGGPLMGHMAWKRWLMQSNLRSFLLNHWGNKQDYPPCTLNNFTKNIRMEESNCIFACCLGHAFSYFDQTLSFISIFLVTANKRNKEEIKSNETYLKWYHLKLFSMAKCIYKYHYICALPGN